jgi:site-specific recombinase XerC
LNADFLPMRHQRDRTCLHPLRTRYTAAREICASWKRPLQFWQGAVFESKGRLGVSSKQAKCGHLTTVARQFQNARKDAGLPDDLVLYCARHGFGTEMYRATKNLFAVMKAMGHAAVATTMKYQHQDIDEIAHVASQRLQ